MGMQEATPLISIVIPVYNVEGYLDRCIDSVIRQTYRNIEIVLINDGSRDSSGLLCDDYSKRDSRIRVIHQENAGLSAARNAGIAASDGIYIAFVDSDDYVEAEYIERLASALLLTDADVAICGFRYEDESGEEIYVKHPPSGICNSKRALQAALLEELSLVVAWNKLYSKRVFDNLRFVEGKQHEDEFMAHHLIDQIEGITCINDVLYHYVRHEGSLTTAKSSLGKFDVIEAYCDRFRLYKERGYDELLSRVTSRSAGAFLRILDEGARMSIEEMDRAKSMKCLIRNMEKELLLSQRIIVVATRLLRELAVAMPKEMKSALSESVIVSKARRRLNV